MRKTIFCASLLCALISAEAMGIGGDMGGADPNGSAEHPYLIEDMADFDEFAGNSAYWASGVHTKLMTDIDLSDRIYTTAPIAGDTQNFNGFQGIRFSSHFDGNNHIINNLTIQGGPHSLPGRNFLGLFGIIDQDGKITNLDLKDVNITGGRQNVGGLCGRNSGNITNCYLTGTVSCYGYQGGFAGGNSGQITECVSDVNVIAQGSYVGGFVGENWGGIITNCISGSNIIGGEYVGGFVGSIRGGVITNCIARGDIEGAVTVGGFAGTNSGAEIHGCRAEGDVMGFGNSTGGLIGLNLEANVYNSSAHGTVTGTVSTGGLIGIIASNSRESEVADCFSLGNVNGDEKVGGLIGYIHGRDDYSTYISGCYSCGKVNANTEVGGLIGSSYVYSSLIISECFSTSHIDLTSDYGGGLIGRSYANSTVKCFAAGNVVGSVTSSYLGGLVGYSENPISKCYAIGSITGNDSIGGLVGVNRNSIDRCYAAGTVSGSANVGGLVGTNSGWIRPTNVNFWNTETSDTNDGVGNMNPDPAGVEGKTTAEMMMQGTYIGWDFDPYDGDPADWMMLRSAEDYPRLAWQGIFPGDIAGLYGADMVDFAYVANYWGLIGCNSGTDCGRADIDASGDVSLGDLASIAADWVKKVTR